MTTDSMTATEEKPHRCPVWVGYLLASPIRRLFHNPDKILSPHLREGMTVLDFGCAMGFFSVPAARMVGERGRVIAVDVEERMLSSLRARAAKAGVSEIIEPRLCQDESVDAGLPAGSVDFAFAFAVVHEVPDERRLLSEIALLLAPGARLLLAEPKGHVSAEAFEQTLDAARAAGLVEVERPKIARSHAALLARPRGRSEA